MADVATQLYGKEGSTTFGLLPKTIASQVTINDVSGGVSTVDAEIVKLRQQISAAADAGVRFKGVVTADNPLPSVAYQAGWQYAVGEAGTYADKVCEVGDFIVCIKTYASGSASNADWAVLQANLTGVVTGPETSVASHVAIFEGTNGKIIADSGFTIAKSVPADAQFTDTTYAPATAQADGLMTAAQFTKLSGIAEGADKTTANTVSAAGGFITSRHTADNIRDGTTKVVMTVEERSKLTSIEQGAEVNQNALGVIKVGTTTISATTETDTLELAAGEGITLTPDATAKKVTVAETYIDSCVVSDLDNVPANLRNGGLIILKS